MGAAGWRCLGALSNRLPPCFPNRLRPGLTNDGSGFCVRALWHHCFAAVYVNIGFESGQSISHRTPMRAAAIRCVSRPLFEAAKAKQPFKQSGSGQICHAQLFMGKSKAPTPAACGQYCELWLSLTGPRLWARLCLSFALPAETGQPSSSSLCSSDGTDHSTQPKRGSRALWFAGEKLLLGSRCPGHNIAAPLMAKLYGVNSKSCCNESVCSLCCDRHRVADMA
jgi:hypothetical protein